MNRKNIKNLIAKFLQNDSQVLTGIILIAVSLQLFVLFFVIDPYQLFWSDSKIYWSIANNLANGLPFTSPEDTGNLVVSPLYPYFLSVLIAVFGSNLMFVRLIHIFLYTLFILSVFQLGKKYKNVKVGLICALICAVYPLYLYIPISLYSESLSFIFFPAIVLLMYELRKKSSFVYFTLLSLLLGLSVFIRVTNIYWIPFAAFYIFFKNSRYNLVAQLKNSIVIVSIPILLVSVWIVRNKIVHDEFMFTRAGSLVYSRTFNENNIPGSKENVELPERIEKRISEATSRKEVDEIRKEEALNFIINNKFRAAQIVFMNCVNYWNPMPKTYRKHGYAKTKYKVAIAIPYTIVLLLAMIGMFKKRHEFFTICLFVLLILNTGFNAPLMVSVRYRMIIDFVLVLYASITIYEWFNLKKIFTDEY